MKKLLLLLLPIVFSSCATMFHRVPNEASVWFSGPVDIYHDGEQAHTYSYTMSVRPDGIMADTGLTCYTVARVYLGNSPETVTIAAVTQDGIIYEYEIEPSVNGKTWWNFFNIIGFPVDAGTGNIWRYPSGIDIDLETGRIYTDTEGEILMPRVKKPVRGATHYSLSGSLPGRVNIFDEVNKAGRTFISVSLPALNSYVNYGLRSMKYGNTTGTWGIGLGLEHFYKNRRSFSLNADVITDAYFMVPRIIFSFLDGNREHSGRFNLSLSHNHHSRRWSFGYGVNMSRNRWDYSKYKIEDYARKFRERGEGPSWEWLTGSDVIKQRSWTAGAVLTGYYKPKGWWSVGLIYRPSAYSWGYSTGGMWKYEHSVSLDFRFRINAMGEKKKLESYR